MRQILTPERVREYQRQAPPELKALRRRSTARSLLAIGADWALIAAFIALDMWLSVPWLTPIFIALIGGRHYALAEVMLHNASHHTLFEDRGLHYKLQWLYAWPFGYDLAVYREEHLPHHRLFLTAEDTECVNFEDIGFGKDGAPDLLWDFWIKPMLGFATVRYGHGHFAECWRVSAFWIAMIGVAMATGLVWPFVLYHVIPRFYVFSLLLFWYGLCEHLRTETGTRTNLSWWTNALHHNDGYHAIHHIFPQIPWFNLPRGHALVPHPFDETRGLLDSWRQMKAWQPPGNYPGCF